MPLGQSRTVLLHDFVEFFLLPIRAGLMRPNSTCRYYMKGGMPGRNIVLFGHLHPIPSNAVNSSATQASAAAGAPHFAATPPQSRISRQFLNKMKAATAPKRRLVKSTPSHSTGKLLRHLTDSQPKSKIPATIIRNQAQRSETGNALMIHGRSLPPLPPTRTIDNIIGSCRIL